MVWLHIVRSYLRLGLFFCYRRIYVINKERMPKKGSILLVSNHNNALIDALLIATKSGRFSYFLTRASVFKKPMVTALLKSLNMLPVYRIRDGWSTISNNNSVFNTCSKLLSQGKVVALFPEGNHNIKRTVRNLSKGFTRIVFETFEKYPNTNLQIVPIGLNFLQADAFADSVSIYFGEPIEKQDYYLENKNESTIQLKNQVSNAIKKLTTHIPDTNYNDDLNKLSGFEANFLNPIAVNNCVNSNFKDCDFQRKQPGVKVLKKVFKVLLISTLIIPWFIWQFYIKPKIDEVEFVATFRFAIAITLVPIWMLLVYLLLASVFGFLIGLSFLLLVSILVLLSVKL